MTGNEGVSVPTKVFEQEWNTVGILMFKLIPEYTFPMGSFHIPSTASLSAFTSPIRSRSHGISGQHSNIVDFIHHIQNLYFTAGPVLFLSNIYDRHKKIYIAG